MSFSVPKRFSDFSVVCKALLCALVMSIFFKANVHANYKDYANGIWYINTGFQDMDEDWYGEVRITASNVCFNFNGHFINGLGYRDGLTITGNNITVTDTRKLTNHVRYCNNGIIVYGEHVWIEFIHVKDYINNYGIFAYTANNLILNNCYISSINESGLCASFSDEIWITNYSNTPYCGANGVYVGNSANPNFLYHNSCNNGHSGLCLNSVLTTKPEGTRVLNGTFGYNRGYAGVTIENCYNNEISLGCPTYKYNRNYGIYRSNSTNINLQCSNFDGNGLGDKNW